MLHRMVNGLQKTLLGLLAAAAAAAVPFAARRPIEWTAYAGDAGGSKYSPADQISRANVATLTPAWIYRTGDYGVGRAQARDETTPIFVDGLLFISTPFGGVRAVDGTTGRERWAFDADLDLAGDYGDFTNRGVSTWLDPAAGATAPCRRRIFVAPVDARLIALDARTGTPCAAFGEHGQIHLDRDLANRFGVSRRVLHHVAAGRSQRTTGGRLIGVRRSARGRPQRHRPGARCPHGRVEMDLGSDPARRVAAWLRLVERSRGSRDRRGQCVVDHQRGRLARSRIRAGRQCQSRFLRRRASRSEPVCQFRGRASRVDRSAGLAFPGRAPRSLGLRHPGTAGALHDASRRPRYSGARAADQDGVPVPPQPRDRRAALPG